MPSCWDDDSVRLPPPLVGWGIDPNTGLVYTPNYNAYGKANQCAPSCGYVETIQGDFQDYGGHAARRVRHYANYTSLVWENTQNTNAGQHPTDALGIDCGILAYHVTTTSGGTWKLTQRTRSAETGQDVLTRWTSNLTTISLPTYEWPTDPADPIYGAPAGWTGPETMTIWKAECFPPINGRFCVVLYATKEHHNQIPGQDHTDEILYSASPYVIQIRSVDDGAIRTEKKVWQPWHNDYAPWPVGVMALEEKGSLPHPFYAWEDICRDQNGNLIPGCEIHPSVVAQGVYDLDYAFPQSDNALFTVHKDHTAYYYGTSYWATEFPASPFYGTHWGRGLYGWHGYHGDFYRSDGPNDLENAWDWRNGWWNHTASIKSFEPSQENSDFWRCEEVLVEGVSGAVSGEASRLTSSPGPVGRASMASLSGLWIAPNWTDWTGIYNRTLGSPGVILDPIGNSHLWHNEGSIDPAGLTRVVPDSGPGSSGVGANGLPVEGIGGASGFASVHAGKVFATGGDILTPLQPGLSSLTAFRAGAMRYNLETKTTTIFPMSVAGGTIEPHEPSEFLYVVADTWAEPDASGGSECGESTVDRTIDAPECCGGTAGDSTVNPPIPPRPPLDMNITASLGEVMPGTPGCTAVGNQIHLQATLTAILNVNSGCVVDCIAGWTIDIDGGLGNGILETCMEQVNVNCTALAGVFEFLALTGGCVEAHVIIHTEKGCEYPVTLSFGQGAGCNP